MSSIPSRLRGELSVHLHMQSMRHAPLFAQCDPSLLYELVMRLKMQMVSDETKMGHVRLAIVS